MGSNKMYLSLNPVSICITARGYQLVTKSLNYRESMYQRLYYDLLLGRPYFDAKT